MVHASLSRKSHDAQMKLSTRCCGHVVLEDGAHAICCWDAEDDAVELADAAADEHKAAADDKVKLHKLSAHV